VRPENWIVDVKEETSCGVSFFILVDFPCLAVKERLIKSSKGGSKKVTA